MDRESALYYIEIAAEERIRIRCQYVLEDKNYIDIQNVKSDIEYYEQVMKYIRENLK